MRQQQISAIQQLHDNQYMKTEKPPSSTHPEYSECADWGVYVSTTPFCLLLLKKGD